MGAPAGDPRPRSRLLRNELIPGSRYRLIRWLGEGGMGVVYEAEHVEVRRRVAVKVLRPEYVTDLDVVDAFRFEARATTQLESPFLVKVHDYFELPDGRSALVMDLLEGHDLSRREAFTLPPASVIAIGRQVCKALHVVHASGLLHRDLKPENIFLCADGSRPDEVRVLDFGIARLSSQIASVQSGGTPMYTPPEAILGTGQDRRSDVYALGCVLYEMLVGAPAFSGETIDATLAAHLDSRPRVPSSREPSVPPALDPVIMKAIAREPEDRFASMAAFEAALCEAQIEAGLATAWDDLPLPEDIPAEQHARLLAGLPDPAALTVPNTRRYLWAAVAASVLITGGLVYALTRPDPAAAVETTSPEERQAHALADEARTAGSRAAWVYPPPDDISSRTAYQAVLELDRLAEVGPPLARELRKDFAATLVRLGNEYWEAEGGMRFAQAYYEQALLFDPAAPMAAERSGLDADALDAFAGRAAQSRFALAELVRVEPLVALAEPTKVPAKERLARVGVHPASSPSIAEDPTEKPAPESAPTVPSPEADAADPKAARALAKQGTRAAKSGNTTRAKLSFEQALAEDPRNVTALAGLRDLAFDAGDYARAVRFGKKVVGVAGRNATHRLRLGDAYYRTRKYANAEKEYAAAARLGDDRARWRLEKTREKLGR
ncbi:MAG: protein kinase [Myxococcota bacterium]